MTTPTPTSAVQTYIDVDKAVADVTVKEIGGMVDPAEFSRQPGLVYYYTTCAARAERQLSSFKLRLEMAEAEASSEAREMLKAAGEKITVDLVKEEARRSTKVTKLDAQVIQAQEVLASIKGLCNALQHKKDMLVMRGHMTRDEIKARLNVDGELQVDVRADTRAREAKVKELMAERAS